MEDRTTEAQSPKQHRTGLAAHFVASSGTSLTHRVCPQVFASLVLLRVAERVRVAKEDFVPPSVSGNALEILDMIAQSAPRIGTKAAAEAWTQ